MRSSQIMPWLGEVSNIPDFLTITASTYTVKQADFGKTIICNSSAAQTITIPLYGLGFNVNILRIGAGVVTLAGGTGVTLTGATTPTRYVNTPVMAYSGTTYLVGETGSMVTKSVTYTEDATSTTHTGTIALPAGSWLHSIKVTSSVLWTGGTAAMDVGDTADPNGYFAAINLKATDLLVGEVLDTQSSTLWGGKEGAYLVAATGQRGPVGTNFGMYYAAGSNILGVVTVGTPATTAGRTFMSVTYSVGETVAATAA